MLGPTTATQAQEPRPGRSGLHTGRVSSRVHRNKTVVRADLSDREEGPLHQDIAVLIAMWQLTVNEGVQLL